MEAEIGLPRLSAKEWPGLLATPEAKREVRGAFFRERGGQRERAWPCRHFEFGLSASRTEREQISVALRHSALGN